MKSVTTRPVHGPRKVKLILIDRESKQAELQCAHQVVAGKASADGDPLARLSQLFHHLRLQTMFKTVVRHARGET